MSTKQYRDTHKEEIRLANRKYRQSELGKAANKKATKKWKSNNVEHVRKMNRQYAAIYYMKHPDKKIASVRKSNLKAIRKAHIALGGGVCADCGTNTKLQFHHVLGNGEQHRQEIKAGNATWMMAWWIIRNLDEAKEILQSLCPKCHKQADVLLRQAKKVA